MKLKWMRFKVRLRWLPIARTVANGFGVGNERAGWKWAGRLRGTWSWATGRGEWFRAGECCAVCGIDADEADYAFRRRGPFRAPQCIEGLDCAPQTPEGGS